VANAPWCRSQPFEHAAFAAACRGHSKKKRFRPSEQLRRDVEEKRAAFLEEVKNIAPDRLIFIDESGCNVAMSPTYGRAPRGQRVLDHKPANWGKNVSIVGAVRADRVLAHQTFDGAVNGPKLIEFVRRRLVPRMYQGDVVVLDNLRAHHAPEVRSLVENTGARLIFLPPYSPDFSPIEPCWAFLTNWLRKLKERVPERLKAAIVRGLRRVTTRHLTSSFLHCGYHFK
jgi:transposase